MDMLSAAARDRLVVVLAGARNPANIGAAARAIHDFGFSHLRVVNDFAAPFDAAQLEAVNSAVSAQHILREAQRYDDLLAAIADCTLVVGTTAIGGRELEQPVEPLQQTAPKVLSALGDEGGKVALVFGSEKTGLTNDQLSHCRLLTTIPLYQPISASGEPARHLSMNLGQSVAVCLYELTRGGFEGSRELPVLHRAAATEADRERLTQLLLSVMQSSDYARRFPANARVNVVRRLVQQLGTSHDEATTWMGLLKMIDRALHPGIRETGDPAN